MTDSPDWGKLYAQGRCKNLGVPWTDEEKQAVYILKVPAEYVRRGCMTHEEVEVMKEADLNSELTTDTMSDEELLKACVDKGVNATADAPRSVLLEELSKAEAAEAEKEEKKKKKKKKAK